MGIAAPGAGAVRCPARGAGGGRAVPYGGCPPPAPLHPAETLWLHIRSLGQWTNKLYEYFQQPELPSPEPKPLSRSLREKRCRRWAQVGADGAQLLANAGVRPWNAAAWQRFAMRLCQAEHPQRAHGFLKLMSLSGTWGGLCPAGSPCPAPKKRRIEDRSGWVLSAERLPPGAPQFSATRAAPGWAWGTSPAACPPQGARAALEDFVSHPPPRLCDPGGWAIRCRRASRSQRCLGLCLPGRSLQQGWLGAGVRGHRRGRRRSADVVQSHQCCCPGRGGPAGGGGEHRLPPSPSTASPAPSPGGRGRAPGACGVGGGSLLSSTRQRLEAQPAETRGSAASIPHGPKLIKKLFLKETSSASRLLSATVSGFYPPI